MTTWTDHQAEVTKRGLALVKEALDTLPPPVLARVKAKAQTMAEEIRERQVAAGKTPTEPGRFYR